MIDTEFQVGALIENRYRVLSVIGFGGMGTLYRVSDEAHQDGARGSEIIALKTVRLKGPAAESPERVEHFQREFQLLTQLRHPNLVSVYDFGVTTEGELYFTMEWIEGGDLEPGQRPLEPGATIPVMVQVCRALAYLHARGVIHGDLKPGNVLMADGQVKLVDFGVAHEVRSPEARARYYTPYYSAPEVTKLVPIDHRADLYSLGAMWFALLVGEPPMFMPGAGKERLIRFALDEALERQTQIPKAIGAVVARLMATSPDDRYGSANEVIEAVNEITGSAYELETRETAASYALRTHFVNREAEIDELQTMWKETQDSAGKLVLISGESGVGKTRLVLELEVQTEMEGARVVWGQCAESGGSAYHPWREVLRVLVRYVESVDETVMQRVGPVLAALLLELWERDYMRELAPPATLDPQAAQRRLNDAVVQILHKAAELRPTVIVIENVQWADEATLELLQVLARIPGHVGLLMCITYRNDEIGADHLLEKLAGEQVRRIRVRRLSPEVTTELVRSMLGLEQLPTLLTERVQQTTGGNAFFVQELIRSLATEGEVLQRTVRGWQVDGKALQKAHLPESIRQVVGRRMGQLSADGRQALSWAAVMGMVFWEGGVAKVGQVLWQQARMALHEGLEQGLIVVRDETAFAGEREYLFLNPTVREVSYDSVLREERQEVHSRAAAWLIDHSDEEVGEYLGLIAEHLEKAGQIDQAVTYLQRAGEQAAAQFANAEAGRYYSRALELIPENEHVQRYDLLLAREKVYDLLGAREVQAQDLAALQDIASLLDKTQPGAVGARQAEVALLRAVYSIETSNYPAAIAASQLAVDLAHTSRDARVEAAGYVQWGQALLWQGKYDIAHAQFEQALTLAQRVGMRQTEADILRNLGIVFHYYPVDLAKARAYWEQALSIYREVGSQRGEAITLSNIGEILMNQGSYAAAKTYFEQSLRICREIGHRRHVGYVLSYGGFLSLRLGDYTEARSDLELALRICREINYRRGEVIALTCQGLLFHSLGDDKVAEEYSQRALLVAQEIGERDMQGRALTNLGHALTSLGRFEEAAESYQQALTLRSEIGQYNLAMESLAGLARLTLARADLTQAQSQVEEILEVLEDGTLEGTDAPLRVYLTCYRVLRANHDPRALDILRTAHRLLQEQAAKITDEEMRRSFLENVAAHREIVYEFSKT